jgi:hypothetical protein
LILYVKI